MASEIHRSTGTQTNWSFLQDGVNDSRNKIVEEFEQLPNNVAARYPAKVDAVSEQEFSYHEAPNFPMSYPLGLEHRIIDMMKEVSDEVFAPSEGQYLLDKATAVFPPGTIVGNLVLANIVERMADSLSRNELDVYGQYGNTALHAAFRACRLSIAPSSRPFIEELLLKYPALLFVQDEQGNSPLHILRGVDTTDYNSSLEESIQLALRNSGFQILNLKSLANRKGEMVCHPWLSAGSRMPEWIARRCQELESQMKKS